MYGFDHLYAVLPQGIVLLAGSTILLLSLWIKAKYHPCFYVIALLGLGLSALFSSFALNEEAVSFLYEEGRCDALSSLINTIIALTVGFVLIYTKDYMTARQVPVRDILILMLFSTVGMMVLTCAQTILSAFLGLELLSLPLYALTAICRTDGDATEAALKYFIMGAIASAMLMFGFSFLYGITGQLHFETIAKILHQTPPHSSILLFALVFILAGIGFKLALAPFHMWAPDVYQASPLFVTLFLSTAPKLAGIAFLIHLLLLVLPDLMPASQSLLMWMAILSISIGNLLAIVQHNIKRLLAYSAIAHLGFATLGIVTASPDGYVSSICYIIVYVWMACAAFGALILLSHQGLEIEEIKDLKGLNQRNPWVAGMLMLTLFSMAGIPPTAGFFIKLLILKTLIQTQHLYLALVAVLLTVMGAFYYINIIKTMYFDAPTYHDRHPIGKNTRNVCFSINCLSLLYFGIFPASLVALCSAALG